MQGFILNSKKVKNEDLVVTILTQDEIITLYRFYGARHSTLNLGYLIDFEIEISNNSNFKRLRNISHIPTIWNLDHNKMKQWQVFIKFIYKYLQNIEIIDNFYFELLNEIQNIWQRQNTKRIILESFIKILKFDGKLDLSFICHKCSNKIVDKISLDFNFMPFHTYCLNQNSYAVSHIEELFQKNSTIFLNNNEVDNLINFIYL